MSAETEPGRPVLRVISGDATDEEIAAILAIVAARGAAAAAASEDPGADVWSSPAAGRRVRGHFVAGAHGWRTSFWPR